MFWPNINKETNASGYFEANSKESTLRHSLVNFLKVYGVKFDEYGDSYVQGTKDYSNNHTDFEQLCELFLYKNWIVPGITKEKEKVWYGLSNITKSSFRNQWEYNRATFQRNLPNYKINLVNGNFVFWVIGVFEEADDKNLILLGQRDEKVYGPVEHPQASMRRKGKTNCFFVEFSDDLVR